MAVQPAAVTLQEWISAQPRDPSKPQGPYSPAVEQAMFVRDRMHEPLIASYEASKAHPVLVPSEHTSKSITLPVYEIAVPGKAVLYARCNFHDWRISVDAQRPIPDIFGDLFDRERTESSTMFEGFAREWIFGSYAQDPSRFSVSLHPASHYAFLFAWLLGQALHAGQGASLAEIQTLAQHLGRSRP